ncbi:MAG: helix-turn-helix domain-containing protein [Oscillospiraceae bacterium]|nr:helix-turn-helix domain-containing protein [Oscillospiraceae bacterium]
MNRIKELREEHKISQAKLAQIANVHQTAVSQWEKGRTSPDIDSAKAICRHFNVSLDWLLGQSGVQNNVEPASYFSPSVIRIPVLGRIPAGVPMEAIEDIQGYEEAPADWARGDKEFFALKLRGDSMFPEYRDGDTVIFRRQDTCESGDDCAVMVNGNDATFKRVHRNENGIVLQPLNPAYPAIPYSNEQIIDLPVRVIGVVWEIRRKMR